MMRIRYMELPTEIDGDQTRTPFIIIFDRVPGGRLETINEEEIREQIMAATRAIGVLIFEPEVQIGDDY